MTTLMLSGILDGIQRSEMLLGPSIILSMLRCLRSFDLPGLIFSLPVDHRCCTQAIIIVVLANVAFDHSIFLDLSSIFLLIIGVVLQSIITVVLSINDKLTLLVKHTKHPLHYLF
jgi:hypothetical protein